MRINYSAMPRPIRGREKRVKLTLSAQPSDARRWKEFARSQDKSLSDLAGELIEKERARLTLIRRAAAE